MQRQAKIFELFQYFWKIIGVPTSLVLKHFQLIQCFCCSNLHIFCIFTLVLFHHNLALIFSILGYIQCFSTWAIFMSVIDLATKCVDKAQFIFKRKRFLSLCRVCISVFLGHECLTDRSILKRYLKSDIATWVEKKLNFKSVLRSWHRILLVIWKHSGMSVLLLAVAFESEWKHCSSLQSDEKMLAFEYEFSCRQHCFDEFLLST